MTPTNFENYRNSNTVTVEERHRGKAINIHRMCIGDEGKNNFEVGADV